MGFGIAQQKLSYNLLSEWLRYEPDTGHFYWRRPKRRGQPKGVSRAGHRLKTGYRRIIFDRMQVRENRLAWLFITKEWPDGEVDHINGVRDDNSAKNLRVVAREFNQNNRIFIKGDGLPGGIFFRPARYEVNMYSGGKKIYCGQFDGRDEALRAYAEMGEELRGPEWYKRFIEKFPEAA